MRGVAYVLTASVALAIGALSSASAGCYGECNGYQDNRYGPPAYRHSYREPVYQGSYDGGPRYHTTYYERGEEYLVSHREYPVHRSSYYDEGYKGGYNGDGGYYERPYRRYHSGYSYDRPRYGGHGYGRGYGYGHGYSHGHAGDGYRGYDYGYGHPTVRIGGGWSQTASALGYGHGGYGYSGHGYNGYGHGSSYAGWGGCGTAYIPYGWTWVRARSC